MAVVHGAPAALAEPVVPVRRSWVGLLFAANLGMWMAFFTPVQILLPDQIAAIDLAGKEVALGWVTGLGALVAIVVNPLSGAYSDRTRLRIGAKLYGRRHVWTLSGATVAFLSFLALGAQHTILGVALGWIGVQIGLNVMLAALSAAVPDRVPVSQRGAVSGWVGMPQALGLVLGAVLVTELFTGTFAGNVVMAVGVLALAVPFALFTPDDPLPSELPPAARTAAWTVFRGHPDYAWAWGTRFMVQLGNALGTLYLLYFLTDEVKVADPGGSLLVMILIYTAGMVATAVVGGRLSDKSGRRKIFVVWSGIVIALAAAVLAIWPNWPASLVASFLLGAGYGVFLAVDMALITQVLPAATDRAKDLGVINIATAAPSVIGPVIAAFLVVSVGGYRTLFAVTGAVTLLGAAMVVRIKSVP